MASPFDDENSTYLVLVNDENQHSLWLSRLDVPAGWSVVHGPADRRDCLDYVEGHWTDLRPASLAAAMRQQR
jgi:MbtH protein